MSQVDRIAGKFESKAALARALKLDPSAITHMKKRGGLIPVRYHQAIIDAALARGVTISPADFFDPPQNQKTRGSRKAMAAAE